MPDPIAPPSPASIASAPIAPTNSNAPGNVSEVADTPRESSAPSQTQTYEVKVNGKMIKMTHQQLIDNASMVHAANERFSEGKKAKQDYERLSTSAKKNSIQALLDPSLGLTKDQIRADFEDWYNKEYIEPESLSPEQRKLKEYEAKIKAYEDDQKSIKEKSDKEESDQLTNKQREYLQGQIIEALETSGLPKTKFFAGRMAFYMKQNAMNGWQAPISLIVQQVKNERQGMMTDFSEGSTAEQLISLLGDNVINKIRQHDLKQLRERRNSPSPQMTKTESTKPGEKVTWQEVQRRLRDMKSGKL